MNRKIFVLIICTFFLTLCLANISAIEMKNKKNHDITDSDYEKIRERSLVLSTPYLKGILEIEFTGGDLSQIEEFQDLLIKESKIRSRLTNFYVRNISFNITYSGIRFRRATYSFLDSAWFIPYYDDITLFNKPFNCTIKNFSGNLWYYRSAFHRPFLGFFCPARITMSGVYYNGTISEIQ